MRKCAWSAMRARSASQSACAIAGRYADLIRILHVAYTHMLKDNTCARGLVRIRHKRYMYVYIYVSHKIRNASGENFIKEVNARFSFSPFLVFIAPLSYRY